MIASSLFRGPFEAKMPQTPRWCCVPALVLARVLALVLCCVVRLR